MSLWMIPVIPMSAAVLLGVNAAFRYLGVAFLIISAAMFVSLYVTTPQFIGATPIQCLVLRMAALVFFSATSLLSRRITQNQHRLLTKQESEVRQAKSDHDAAAASKANFFANFSHEIRTPMNGILGMTEFLLALPLRETVKDSVETMHRCAGELLELLNQILDLSALEYGNRTQAEQRISLEELVKASVLELKRKSCCSTFNIESLTHDTTVEVAPNILKKILDLTLHFAAQMSCKGEVVLQVQGAHNHGTRSIAPQLWIDFCSRSSGECAPETSSAHHSDLRRSASVSLSIAEQLAHLMQAELEVEERDKKGHERLVLRFDASKARQHQNQQQSKAPIGLRALWTKLKSQLADSERSEPTLVLAMTHAVIMPAAVGYCVYAWIGGHEIGFSLHALAAVLLGVAIVLNLKYDQYRRAAWVTVVAGMSLIAFVNLSDGQIRSESLWLLPLIPVGSLFILGVRPFVGLFVLSIGVLVAVFFSTLYYPVEQEYQESFWYLYILRLVVLQIFSSIYIVSVYASQRFSRLYKQRRRAMLEALTASERAHDEKSKFLTNMSHEIRTPMNGILGLAEDLVNQDLPQQQEQAIQTIHRCGGHLLALLGDVFDVSEDEGNMGAITKVPMCLHEVLNDVVFLFSAKAKLKGMALVARGANGSLRVLGDRTRLIQVLSNLVGNAVKFSDRGMVQLSLLEATPSRRADEDGYKVRIEVRDQGIGIAESQLDRLFHSFVQIEASNASGRGGSGLGLAICRRLVKAMDGELKVHSAPGEGSVFELSIWMATADAMTRSGSNHSKRLRDFAQPSHRPVQQRSRNGRKILVVDDNLVNLKVASATLNRLGYDVHTAKDGREAVNLAHDTAFDAILMDVRMPEIDGLKATSMIREGQGACKNAPILALTADSYEEQKRLCMEAGMNGHLAKPFRAQDLSQELQALWSDSSTKVDAA